MPPRLSRGVAAFRADGLQYAISRNRLLKVSLHDPFGEHNRTSVFLCKRKATCSPVRGRGVSCAVCLTLIVVACA